MPTPHHGQARLLELRIQLEGDELQTYVLYTPPVLVKQA